MNPFTIDEIIYIILKSDSHKTFVLLSNLNTQFNKIFMHAFDSYDVDLSDFGENVFSSYTSTISHSIKPHKNVTVFENHVVIIDNSDNLKGILDDIGPVDDIKTLTTVIKFSLNLIREKYDKIPVKSRGFFNYKDVFIENFKYTVYKDGTCRVLINHKYKNKFMKSYKQLIEYLKSK